MSVTSQRVDYHLHAGQWQVRPTIFKRYPLKIYAKTSCGAYHDKLSGILDLLDLDVVVPTERLTQFGGVSYG